MILDSPERSAPFHKDRLARLRGKIAAEDIDALLVTNITNVRYLSGFSGTSAVMLATPEDTFFLTDFRYTTQAEAQVIGPVIREYKEQLDDVSALLSELGINKLWVEAGSVSLAVAEKMREKFNGVELEGAEGAVESVRLIKDEPEIEAIRALLSMLEKVFPEAARLIRPGAVERDVAVELEYRLRKAGADGPAFDFIVASGPRSAMPHGVASGKVIGKDEMITLDWGAAGWGYNSDNTRDFATGKVDPELEKIYDITLEANLAAIDAVKPGVTVKDVDDAARNIIKKAGYGEAFGHGTGHGVGMDIHEKPTVSWRDGTELAPGMVFTIEPGIYLPGKGGVRIEDMILVTDSGREVLSKNIPKKLIRL